MLSSINVSSNISSLSIVLPTINESENLKILIPEITMVIQNMGLENYEILVVDDGSTDTTFELVEELRVNDDNLKLIKRTKNPSLPLSILEGITKSQSEYVMWLDADNSMNAKSVKKLIEQINEKKDSVVIGSRFTEGGGYKGVKDLSETSIFSAMRNVNDSNDSVLGMIASNLFNKFLIAVLNLGVKDITSGFIIGKKEVFNEEPFLIADYGDYFIYLVNDLRKNKVDIIEVGYICETRIFGETKTASSIAQLFRRGIPYLKAVVQCRIDGYGNKRQKK